MSGHAGSARWSDMTSRIARFGAVGTAALAGTTALATIVLWDADFYALRDRWEHFKIAMFGEWTPSVADDRPIRNLFRDIKSVAVFREVPIEGTGLSVVTGSRFTSPADLLAGRASRLWCYVNAGDDAVGTLVELGTQSRGEQPNFAGLDALSSTDLPQAVPDAASLERLARTHCRFIETSKTR